MDQKYKDTAILLQEMIELLAPPSKEQPQQRRWYEQYLLVEPVEEDIVTQLDDTYNIVIYCRNQAEQDHADRMIRNMIDWIPSCTPPRVPQTLPDKYCPKYNVTLDNGIVTTLHHSSDGRWFDDTGDVYTNVIAWMPLPQRYIPT